MLLQTSAYKHHKHIAYLSNCERGGFLFLLVLLRDNPDSGKIAFVGSLVSRVIWKSQEFASEPHFLQEFYPPPRFSVVLPYSLCDVFIYFRQSSPICLDAAQFTENTNADQLTHPVDLVQTYV